jgi:hypothetical protein
LLLQSVEELRLGQAAPPFFGEVTTERVRVFLPVPQDLVHSDHEFQAETSQSVGHELVLHTRDWA